MGVVYRAVQPRLGRRVALKVIAPEYARDDRFRQRFERESRLAASIDHPHVVPIYEAGEADGLLYIVMRYVDGPDLAALVAKQRRLAPDRAARIVAQAASALDAAHARGLVHRDVKPANVLLVEREGDGEGEEHAYLTDFGLTKRTASQSGLTGTGIFVGTIDFVAPEQVRGESLDARADVYALACLLFHALTGEVPYPRDEDMAKMYAHAQLEPPAPSDLVPGLPRQFDAVVARGMAKDRAGRYPSAGDLGRAACAAAQCDVATAPERSVAAGAATLVAPDDGDGARRRAPVRPSVGRRQRPGDRAEARSRTVHRSRRRLRSVGAVAVAAILGLGITAALLAALGGEEADRGSPPEVRGAQAGDAAQGAPNPTTAPPSGAAPTPAPPPVEPLGSDSTVTTQGVGPVLAGMTVAEAEEAAQTSLVDDSAASCRYVSPAGLSGVSFMVVNGEVARSDITEPTVATRSGIRVGASADAVREAYGDRIEEEEGLYDNTLLTFVPNDPSDETRLVFDTDGIRVTGMQAGRLPEVEYPEGCF